jgi:hypothetical protein
MMSEDSEDSEDEDGYQDESFEAIRTRVATFQEGKERYAFAYKGSAVRFHTDLVRVLAMFDQIGAAYAGMKVEGEEMKRLSCALHGHDGYLAALARHGEYRRTLLSLLDQLASGELYEAVRAYHALTGGER